MKWLSPALWLLFSAACLAVFYSIGVEYGHGWDLRLHSTTFSTPHYQVFLLQYTFFGLFAAWGIAKALIWGFGSREDRVLTWWRAGDDRVVVGIASLLAVAFPVLIHHLVLRGVDLTADEGAYRYAAELLAHGRLTNPSHPMPAFFDRAFMVNDGRYYAQYFLGWPALLAPGALLGLPWLINPLLSGVTVPAVFLTVRRLMDRDHARAAVLLFLLSPMILVGAATQMSHTSCLALGVWCTWLVLRSTDDDAPVWVSPLFAALFCLGFFVRPLSTLALGLPLLAFWGWSHRTDPVRLGAFALPAVLGAILFFAVNQLQHGDPLMSGYEAYRVYLTANPTDFSGVVLNTEIAVPNLAFTIGSLSAANLGVALFRLNYAWMGWPIPLFFLLFVPVKGNNRLFVAMVVSYFGILLFTRSAGVDTFGPVHFFEGMWPLSVLVLLGMRGLQSRLAVLSPRPLVMYGVASLVVVSLLTYLPIRMAKVYAVASTIRLPLVALEEAGVTDNAVVFYDYPWAPLCARSRHFNRAPPLNTVDWDGPLVIAGNLGPEENTRFLAEHYPERAVYYLREGRDRPCIPEVVRER